ncbi:nucleotidyltransferase domain-containing protein [Pseudonocardia sp. DSM 110487]|uniref:nucleotidyltransferase domain-containing protein n=1 Tax=Pseudonocardia sp. DSM 110487 TaxID=2865833 RepID=UPI001C6A8316|nr:nucleotidyltransferase domain-containing protein [Pseudonocardia sp. DSM 110487]QYN36087.1 nucleotidyltransferase domain-containing protein [Pseudonocardia sp. DSM 110487]
MAVLDVIVPRLVSLPGVVAVVLGGSRARGTNRPDSNWDIGLYYRGGFDAGLIAGLGFPGRVAQPGEWGRIVNGGAWLSVDGAPVDVLLRDLDVIEGWLVDAQAGHFEIDNVEGHIAGLPTYTPVGELAISRVLHGRLPRVTYPDALRTAAGMRWRWGGGFSLVHAEKYARRGDVTLAAGTMARATAQTAHGVLAERGEWVLNEKGIVDAAGLAAAHEIIGTCARDPEGAVRRMRELLSPPRLDELNARTAGAP